MKRVGAYEAKTHLPRLLEQVSQGESFVITKHGVPVARLVPYSVIPIETRQKAIEQIQLLRSSHRSDGNLHTWIDEGRM
jgi:prevent-host-death family protein